MSEDKKELEVVSGDGSNLDISPVYEHLNAGKPKGNRPKNIVIPKRNSDDKKDNVVENRDDTEKNDV